MQRNGSSHWALASILVAIVLLSTIPGVAVAKTEVGPTVVVERGETLSDDLTTAGGTVIILGTVDGDVTALAGDVVVSGEVTGDVTALAGRVDVTGQVGGKVTAFSGVTTAAGTVGDGIDAIGGALTVSGDVAGTVDTISILVTVEDDARVDGQLRTTAVRTQVNGTVLGGEGRTSNQSLVGLSDSPGVTEPTPGPTSEPVAVSRWQSSVQLPFLLVSAFVPIPAQILPFGISFLDAYGFFVTLLLGILLVGLLPRFSDRVASNVVRDPVRTAGFGLATAILTPIALVLLGVSLFGLPLALAGGAIFLVLWWVGAVYGRFAVGVWLLEAVPRVLAYADVDREPIENRWVSLLVGVFVVGILVSIPVIGPVVDTAIAVLGVGAIARLVYDAYARTERTERLETDASEPLGED
ncbi:hypothetical protein GJR96_16600 [Haloferax sp. MBLA0076]|uniref:DUF8173 domain-containing protein n=1 Tax=Haloferax litoreum TaxID=2666140 RepID=A0A6A8GKD0_9EURY|nr:MULTISPECIES: polymer-forming cytoskeletal protein [Haloferax]KAB1190577.1 polymer-forming cytoskeletal protein [Haloferax sp. CBA1148]MRX23565.1 hypothetical protein [Haloferax litoreum]